MPFAAGVAVPLAIFLGRYVLAGSQSRLRRDSSPLAATPARRRGFEPSLLKIVGGVLINLILIAAAFLIRGRTARKPQRPIHAGDPRRIASARWTERYVDRADWGAIWTSPAGRGRIWRGPAGSLDRCARSADSSLEQKIFLVLSVTAACSLIQFPFTIRYLFLLRSAAGFSCRPRR